MTTASAHAHDGGLPARRAVLRWSLRLYRREWRQQVLICVLIAAAVAATILAAGLVTGSRVPANAGFGTANQQVQLAGFDPHLDAEVASLHRHFGPIAVISSTPLTTGTVQGALVEAFDPHGPFVGPLVQLADGRYPTSRREVALTSQLAQLYNVHVGGTWRALGTRWRVVGEVQNPTDLHASMALVVPGAITRPASVTVLFDATGDQLASFRPPKAYYDTLISSIQPLPAPTFDVGAFIVLVAGTFGMLFIGLIAVAGFTVMGRRRTRAIGMLGALGAAESKVRLVLLMNGLVVGFLAMVLGGTVGLAAWWWYAPHQQASVGHVVDPASIPWWLVITALVLAPVTATLAAWRPARALARMPVVAALSGRPNEPHASRRNAAIGAAILGGGVLLTFAGSGKAGGGSGSGAGVLTVLLGIVLACLGLFLVSQWIVAQLGRVAAHAPLSARIALRDLARYRSRSGAALGAICLAIVMTGVVVVASTARYSDPFDYVGPNLASNVVQVYPPLAGGTEVTQPCGTGYCTHKTGPVPHLRATFRAASKRIAVAIGATSSLTLYQADASLVRTSGGRQFTGQVYVATPALLAHYGIPQSSIDPRALVLSSRPTLPGTSGLALTYGSGSPQGGPGQTGPAQTGPCPPGYCVPDPFVQAESRLPTGTSAANTVLTMHAVRSLHLTLSSPQAIVLTTAAPLSTQQKNAALVIANGTGASIETASSFASLNQVLGWALVLGLLVALGVLAMTVGLIRAETASELRVLTAAGAARRTRRALTSVTAGALGFVGAVLGVVTAYLLVGAFLANNFSDNLAELTTNPPLRPIGVLVLGLPLLAAVGGWLFSAREPAAIGRQPLE
ncbi:MAG TPA: FtsX-like permease family protein [Acidimicrobiales bacterium]|nr:FtsX-like permease family protein [Acidimicrobiales bacterium]